MSKRIVFILVLSLLAVVGCNKATRGLSPDGYANQGTKVASESAALSPYEQKEKLEDTGKELIEELDVDNWTPTADFMSALSEHFAELDEDAFYAFEEWSEDIEDQLLNVKKRDSKLTLRVTYALSKLQKGRFVEEDGEFVFKEGGLNLQVITYVDGKKVTITMTNGLESKEYEVYSEHWKASNDWDKRYYDGEGYSEWDETVSIKIPAWINIEIKEGLATRVNWKANFSFRDSDGNGKIELEKDAADISTELKFADYSITEYEKYSSSKGVGHVKAGSAISRGLKTLVSAGAEGDIEIDGSMEDSYKGTLPKNVKCAVDVLGKVQAKGTLDYEKVMYVSEKLDRYATEKEAEKYARELEKSIDVAIYYDRKSGRQAWFGVEPVYNDRNGWNYTPVIRFADDSSYGLGEFFNQEDFQSLLAAMNDWAEDVAYYFGAY